MAPGPREDVNGLFSPPHIAEEQGLFGLAPGGVYQATLITQDTGGLLPRLFTLIHRGSRPGDGMFSVALSVSRPFGGTKPSELRTTLPYGARTFLPSWLMRSDHPFPFDSPLSLPFRNFRSESHDWPNDPPLG